MVESAVCIYESLEVELAGQTSHSLDLAPQIRKPRAAQSSGKARADATTESNLFNSHTSFDGIIFDWCLFLPIAILVNVELRWKTESFCSYPTSVIQRHDPNEC